MSFTVAIIGRPNVGKSSLFNRMIQSRKSIIDDKPGITRDRIYSKVTWLDKEFSIIDTGGIGENNDDFNEEIKLQAEIAINESDLILFVVDGKAGINNYDLSLSKWLYKSKKKVILVVNKIDDKSKMGNTYDFFSLGFGEPIGVSSIHGIGLGDLLDKITSSIPKTDKEFTEKRLTFSIVGRPNVGKSTLMNAILNENRVITSHLEGTTRDAVDTKFEYNNKKYMAVDTAGIKKRGKIYESYDRYSFIRAKMALEKSDVALLIIDASKGVYEQDKNIGGLIKDYKKALVIVVNKWDLINKESSTMEKHKRKIKDQFQFFEYSEIVFISALNRKRIKNIFESIDKAYINYNKKIKTSTLNEILINACLKNPTKIFNRGRANFSYITQSSSCPPTFQLFVNNPNYVHFSYLRYLENSFRKEVDFLGTPLNFILRKKDYDEI